MTPLARISSTPPRGWYTSRDCRLEDFREVVEEETLLKDYRHADSVVENVLTYGPGLAVPVSDEAVRRAVQAELARALADGPGIVVFKHAFDLDDVERATGAFERLIAEQRAAGVVVGDHFAKPGANDRVWGALDKLAIADPETFASYYANDLLALVSEAWLGPHYQVTSQVNVVNPGGQAQIAHRDYHLGFMDRSQAEGYPVRAHALAPFMTLQGAVAHVDMPVETGPTMYLPHSQKYGPGYVAYHDPVFTEYFETHHVQLALEQGDAVFFNPALFHGAGTNRSADVARMANLLQVSSAFGRTMETVDTTAICRAIYPVLQRWRADGVDARLMNNLVAAGAEGYPFPTNLDLDQPVGSLAPLTQADLLHQALDEGWSGEHLSVALAAQLGRRRSQVG